MYKVEVTDGPYYSATFRFPSRVGAESFAGAVRDIVPNMTVEVKRGGAANPRELKIMCRGK